MAGGLDGVRRLPWGAPQRARTSGDAGIGTLFARTAFRCPPTWACAAFEPRPEREARDIQLVLIVGDIGWGEEGLALSHELLSSLSIPWVPILGDNEVQYGSEAGFDATYADHGGVARVEGLASVLRRSVGARRPAAG